METLSSARGHFVECPGPEFGNAHSRWHVTAWSGPLDHILREICCGSEPGLRVVPVCHFALRLALTCVSGVTCGQLWEPGLSWNPGVQTRQSEVGAVLAASTERVIVVKRDLDKSKR